MNNRRAFLSSLAGTILFAADPARALICDERSARQGDIRTHSYTCRLGSNRALTATFLRMSDVVADNIGGAGSVPGGYDALLANGRMIDTPVSRVLDGLQRDYAFAFEPYGMEITFDGRKTGGGVSTTDFPGRGTRFRTLGAWDDLNPDKLPFFPLPDELRRAMRAPEQIFGYRFLRHALRQDFDRLPDKIREYTRLWQDLRDQIGALAQVDDLGNLDLMNHVDAGSVDGFLPLYFSSVFVGGCTEDVHGGAYFVPPALHVDAMVCRNTGTEPIRIQDFFGAEEKLSALRPYDTGTPPGRRVFGWAPVELAPGESVVALQRLLFWAKDQTDPDTGRTRRFTRAVFGPTQLPKGVVLDNGESFSFDGRSHNALIVASYNAKGSCPYLSSWCDSAREWVRLGKVLTECDAPERDGEDCLSFGELRTRFKLVEREHERTVLRAARLEIDLRDGRTVTLDAPHSIHPAPAGLPLTLDIGQVAEFAFRPPATVRAADVLRTRLRLGGHYRTYRQADFDRCRERATA